MFRGRQVECLTALLVLLLVIGCGTGQDLTTSQVPTRGSYTSADEVLSLVKAYGQAMGRSMSPSTPLMAPSSGNWSTAQYVPVLGGGTLSLAVPGVVDSVLFRVHPESLRPIDGPDGTTISMRLILTVGKDAQGNDTLSDLTFEFGPSGTQFVPEAELVIPFEVLFGINSFAVSAESFGVIEEGISYDIDWTNEELITYVPHFSKYYFDRR